MRPWHVAQHRRMASSLASCPPGSQVAAVETLLSRNVHGPAVHYRCLFRGRQVFSAMHQRTLNGVRKFDRSLREILIDEMELIRHQVRTDPPRVEPRPILARSMAHKKRKGSPDARVTCQPQPAARPSYTNEEEGLYATEESLPVSFAVLAKRLRICVGDLNDI